MTFTIPPAWAGAVEKAYDAADDAYTDDKNLRECTVAAITAFFAALEEQGMVVVPIGVFDAVEGAPTPEIMAWAESVSEQDEEKPAP